MAFDSSASIASRIEQLPWSTIEAEVNAQGYATTGTLLTTDECAALITSYADGAAFRSRVVMARHGYGRGEYQYFAYPLPSLIANSRAALYPRLSAIANRWRADLKLPEAFPAEHAEFLGAATRQAKRGRLPYCSNMRRVITTACIKISMANRCSRCKWRYCCRAQGRISKAASLCSLNSVRGCSRGLQWCRCR